MPEATLIQHVMQGGFTALAAFLVWRMASASEADRKASQDRETRMANRINDLEKTLVDLVARSVDAQNNISTALNGLRLTLERKPCLLENEVKRAV